MKIWTKLLIPVAFMVLSGCVVVPRGYHAGGPRVAVVAPVPVVVVRPAYYGRYRW
jgi:starvation-inducible outer membrane lipoprotein